MTEAAKRPSVLFPCCSLDDEQPCPQAATGHDLPCNGPHCATVPESAKHACGDPQPHPAHDWIEQTGEIDYDHYWCVGRVPPNDQGKRP